MVFRWFGGPIKILGKQTSGRDCTKVNAEIQAERERCAARSFGKVAIERLEIDHVDLLGQISPCGSGAELGEAVCSQERPNLGIDLFGYNSAIHRQKTIGFPVATLASQSSITLDANSEMGPLKGRVVHRALQSKGPVRVRVSGVDAIEVTIRIHTNGVPFRPEHHFRVAGITTLKVAQAFRLILVPKSHDEPFLPRRRMPDTEVVRPIGPSPGNPFRISQRTTRSGRCVASEVTIREYDEAKSGTQVRIE